MSVRLLGLNNCRINNHNISAQTLEKEIDKIQRNQIGAFSWLRVMIVVFKEEKYGLGRIGF